jgi:hypothetical protein
MVTFIIDLTKKLLLRLDLYSIFLLKKDSALLEYGWFRSFSNGRPVDLNGNPIPWFTFPAIEFLKSKETKDFILFEYGAGNSTLWWSSRVNFIYSCEHDKQWYNIVFEHLPKNVSLKHIELVYGGDYCREIGKYNGKFHIIIIDGRDRNNCLKNCLVALRDDGIIILDNSDRTEYKEGIEFLLFNGFRKLDFYGMGPINTHAWCTSMFYKDNNCLSI